MVVDKMVDQDMVLVPVLDMAKLVGMDLTVGHMWREKARVEVAVEDKLEVLGIPMLKDTVAAPVLALAMLTGIGMDQVKQVQVLMATVVA